MQTLFSNYTIQFAKHYFRQNGFFKLSCWSVDQGFRAILKQNKFFRRPDVMSLSIFSKNAESSLLTDINTFCFVEGDGDAEYL